MRNLPLTDTRPLAINRLVEKQQSIVMSTRTMKEENEGTRSRVRYVSNEALALERTLSSIKGLQHICL